MPSFKVRPLNKVLLRWCNWNESIIFEIVTLSDQNYTFLWKKNLYIIAFCWEVFSKNYFCPHIKVLKVLYQNSITYKIVIDWQGQSDSFSFFFISDFSICFVCLFFQEALIKLIISFLIRLTIFEILYNKIHQLIHSSDYWCVNWDIQGNWKYIVLLV